MMLFDENRLYNNKIKMFKIGGLKGTSIEIFNFHSTKDG